MQTNIVDMLKTIRVLIFSVLIIAANDCYSSSNQDEIHFNKRCYFDDKFHVSPSVSKFGDSGGYCLNAIKFTIIGLFSGDYVCNLQSSDKQSLCKIIGTTLLKKCIFKKELENGNKIEDIEVAGPNPSDCISKSLILFDGDVDPRMLPCAITFKMHEKVEFLPFYVSRTYEWRMPWNKNRSVLVYLNKEILTEEKKIKENYLLRQKIIHEERDTMVELVGESNEFSFDSNKLEQRAKLQ